MNILTDLDEYGVQYSFNHRTYNLNKLKFIIVGDNPGITEFNENKYFCGESGKTLQWHFEYNRLCSDFYEECMLFNKTILHSAKTQCLKETRSLIGDKLFSELQVLSVREIYSTYIKYNVPILIFGKSELHPLGLFSAFWREIAKYKDMYDKVFLYSHPSNGWFEKEWDLYREKRKPESPMELLLNIGRVNMELISCRTEPLYLNENK